MFFTPSNVTARLRRAIYENIPWKGEELTLKYDSRNSLKTIPFVVRERSQGITLKFSVEKLVFRVGYWLNVPQITNLDFKYFRPLCFTIG
jgi:hypothetical protein